MEDTQPRIQAVNLTKRFGERKLWSDLSFTVRPGEMVAFMGPSGCGKSTLLHCVAGLDRATSGQLFVDGAEVPAREGRAMQTYRATTLGYLFQDFALIPDADAAANVRAALPLRKKRDATTAQDIRNALDTVGLLEAQQSVPVAQLSGGEQQRVAIARLIAKRPAVVLADEPTGSLDDRNSAMIARHLRDLATGQAAVVVVTHDTSMAATCDRVIQL